VAGSNNGQVMRDHDESGAARGVGADQQLRPGQPAPAENGVGVPPSS